jgi:hypothetical protein
METPTAPTVDIAQIAKVCHEANRAYSQTLGDNSLKSWEECDQAQRDSIIQGVLFRINNPDESPGAAHNAWMENKLKNGWKFGSLLNRDAKMHPCIVPFEDLLPSLQVKDGLFSGIVKAMASTGVVERTFSQPSTMTIQAGKKNDPSVEIGGVAGSVSSAFRSIMQTLGFKEAEGSFVYNADGRAIWVNPASPQPTADITAQIVAAAEAIGARAKINQIRDALDIPFEVVATAK